MIGFVEEHWLLIVAGIALLFVFTLAIVRSGGEYDKNIGAK